MGSGKRFRVRTDPLSAVSAWWLAFAAAAIGIPAGAQVIDSTLDDLLNDEIDQQVQEQLDEMIEELVEEQIESDVVDSVEQQIESGVTDSIQQQVEADVAGALTQQLEATIEQTLDDGFEGPLESVLDPDREGIAKGLSDTLEGAGEIVEGAGQAQTDGEDGPAAAPAEPFAAALDDSGRTIERAVWVVWVPAEQAAQIQGWGFTIREQKDVPALERVLLRIDAPEDRDVVQAALDLALDAPGTLVDFNHVYRPGAERPGAERDGAAAARSADDVFGYGLNVVAE